MHTHTQIEREIIAKTLNHNQIPKSNLTHKINYIKGERKPPLEILELHI